MTRKDKPARRGRDEPKWLPGDLHFDGKPIEVLELEDGWHARIWLEDRDAGISPIRCETIKAYPTQHEAEMTIVNRLTWAAKLINDQGA